MDNYNFNSSKFYLGKLCKSNHQWEETSQSLRYKKSRGCVCCDKLRYLKQQKTILAQKKEEYWRDPETARQKMRESYTIHKDKRIAYQKEWASKNRDKRRLYCKRYDCSGKGRLSKFHNQRLRRARLQANHLVKITLAESNQRFADFNNCCVYCGRLASALDHFIPVSKGGPNVLGNLVPACKGCNLSKSFHLPDVWYKAQPFFSVKRWKRILKVLGKTEHNLSQLPLF